jgi:hypothetical protein
VPLQPIIRLSWKLKKIRCRRCGTWVLQKIEMHYLFIFIKMSASVSTPKFTRWTEEERRAHRRKQNATYQARKVEYLTPREKQVKEEERRKRQVTKQAMEQGEWVSTAKVEKKEQKEAKSKVETKNGFAALDSDSEEDVKEVKTDNDPVWGKQKIDWAADSDDE